MAVAAGKGRGTEGSGGTGRREERPQPAPTDASAHERSAELVGRIMEAAGPQFDSRQLARALLEQVRQWTGCEAAAIRLAEAGDYPYFVEQGFPARYLSAENSLFARGEDGGLLLDGQGRPVLECACGAIVQGRSFPGNPHFTAAGTFWTGSTSDSPPGPSLTGLLTMRHRCQQGGYESVACIPLRIHGETYGILQLNSAEKHRITPEVLSVLEPAITAVGATLKERLDDEVVMDRQQLHGALLSTMAEAFAYCRLLYDDAGVPCDWVYLDANEAFAELFDVRDPVGKRNSDVIPGIGESIPSLLEACARVAADGVPERFQEQVRAGKWVDMRLMSLAKDHFFIVCEDISERRRVEESLRATQRIVDQAPDLIQWIDGEGRLVYVNEANTRLLGYSREELLGMHVWDIDPSIPLEVFRERLQQTSIDVRALRESVLTGKDDRTHPVEIASGRLALPEGEYGVAFLRDISDRKQAEEILERMRFSLDHVPDYPLWFERSGRIVEVSEAACRRLEYSRDELLGMTIFDIDPNVWDASRGRPTRRYERLWDTIADLETFVLESTHRTKSGEEFPVEVSVTFVSFGDERYQCGFCRDITVRRGLEESLRATQRSVDQAPDLIYWVDETGQVVYANEATSRLLGYTTREMESLFLWDLDHTLTPEVFRKRWQAAIESGKAFVIQVTFVGKDGERHEIELSNTHVQLHGGYLGVAFGRDVTERNKTEEKLRRTQFTLDRIEDYPIWVTPDGLIADVTESTCRHLEYSRDELLGMAITTIDPVVGSLDKEEFFAEHAKDGRDRGAGDSFIFETTHHTKTGRAIPVEVSLSLVTIGGVEYECSFCRDISERKRLEESLNLTQVSVDQAADMIHWVDESGQIVYANQATADTLGYTVDELSDLHLWDIVAELDPEFFVEKWTEGVGRPSLVHESTMRRKDGSSFPVEVTTKRVEFGGKGLGVSVARDVSERKAAEDKLQRAQYSLDNVGDYVLWADEAGRLLEVTQSACRELGYSREELLDLTVFDIDPELEPERWTDDWQHRETGRAYLLETRHRRKNGELFPVEASASQVTFGGVHYDCAFCRNITDRKRLEHSLLLTQHSVDHAGDMISWVDPSGRFVYVNQAGCRTTGYSLDEIRELHLWDLDPDFTPEQWSEVWQQMKDEGPRTTETTNRSRDGRDYPIEVVMKYLEFEGQEYAVSFVRDITDRKAADERLRRVQYSLDHMLDYVLWTDATGRLVEVSESTCRQLGYTREELLGMSIWDIDPRLTPEHWAKLWKPHGDAGFYFVEGRHRKKSGEDFPVEVAVSRFSFGGREYDCGVCRDVTQRRRLEQSLRLTQHAVDHSGDMIYWIDSDGRFIYANEAACRARGYSLDEMRGLHVWELNPERSVESWKEGWGRVKREGLQVWETTEVDRHGREYQVEITTQHLEFEGQEIAVSVNRDISERKLAEQSLRDSEERYRQLFELESDAHLLIADKDYKILEANQAAVDLYGYGREELLTMSVLQLSDEPDKTRVVAQAPDVDVPLRWHRNKDGTVFPVEGRSRKFEWKGQPVHVVAIRDITERKRAEESLLLTRHAVDHANDMIYWLDPEGNILHANRSMCDILGYSPDEIVGLPVWRLVLDGTPELFHTRWLSVQDEGSALSEDTWVGKDGRVHAVEISSTFFEHGDKIYGVSSAREISQRKLAEQMLRDSEERYRQLFELETDALVLAEDDSRHILEVNQAAVDLYGYSRKELLGMRDTDLFAPTEQTQQQAADEPDGDTSHHYHRRKDGSVFPVEARVRFFEWKGQPVHVAAIRDITERKRAEDDLEESRRMLRLVLDTVPLRISWRDRNLRYMGCNVAVALDAHLSDTSDIVGLRDDDLPWGAAAGEAHDNDREVIATGVPKLQYEETLSSPAGGPTHIMRTSKVPLRDRSDNIIGILSVHEDVTDRVRTLQALRDREEQLRQSQKMEAIGRLAGGIAHDFNNVLTTIIGYSDLILSTEELEPASLREDLAEIKAAAERAGNLTRQILAFSRRQALQPQVLLLNTVISQTERLLERTIGADIELKTLLSPDLGLVEVDEYQFVQILLNLAVNARDAMPDGGTLTLTTSNVRLDEEFARSHPDAHPGNYVLLSVSDDGMGMDPDTAAHVFEPFYTTKAVGQGTGLGLSTVYGVVTQSGGCVTLESALGKGTAFHIYLPRFDHPALSTAGGTPGLSAASDRPTVLVVDDDATFRSLTSRLLEKRGYRVIPVGDGDRAVEILKNRETAVDLLLTDIVMPGSLQGNHVAQIAGNLRPGLPVLFMSAYDRETIVQAGRMTDGVDFLEKPFTTEALATHVRELLERRKD